MHIFISKLYNCLRNAHDSVAVLDEKKKKINEMKKKDKISIGVEKLTGLDLKNWLD